MELVYKGMQLSQYFTLLLRLLVELVLPFISVLVFCLTPNMSDKEELSKLRGSHKVYRRRMESLETEIQALLRRFDIQNQEHRDELRAYKTKYQSKIEEIKTVDSKVLNFLSQLTENLIREDAFIDVMTKIDDVLTKIYNLETNNSEHSSVRQTTSNRRVLLQIPPKLLK